MFQNQLEHHITTHSDQDRAHAVRTGSKFFWATCSCGWRSDNKYADESFGERRWIEARKAAWHTGLDHANWWNKHPQVAHVGANRSDAS